MSRERRCRVGVAASLLLLTGCSIEGTFDEPDPDLNRMLEQPRYDAYESSPYFDDRAVLQKPPEGTVPWQAGGEGHHGREDAVEITRPMLERGRDAFETHCAACHGVDGRGRTVVASHMHMRPPPSLHSERVRELSDPDILRTVREGYGVMRSYAAQLEVDDRRAVVAYVRALQLSRRVRVADLPPPLRRELERVEDP